MSNGLMSCVRENSPPLEMAGNDSGAFSLPSSSTSSDQNKRRRFHPLRNLRRIFRRRTMTSTDASTSSSNIPALTAITTNSNLTQSSPTSPLSQQQQLQYNLSGKSPTVLTIPTTSTTSVPAQHHQNSPTGVLLSSNDITITQSLTTTTATTTSVTSIGRTPAGGIQVIPQFSTNTSSQLSPSSAGGFFMHKQSDKIILKLKNNHHNHHQGGGSSNDFHNNNDNNIENNNEDCIGSSGEMTDNQRSLSEGRLVDSDFNRDSLSQSHDSVFSESATAGSLSLGLKNELFDVLRKRRNRSDASDEDLGLPRSPTILSQENQNITSQTTINSLQNNINNDNDTTISNLMMISSDLEGDDLLGDHTISSVSSSKLSSSFDGSKTSDEIDMSITGGITRLSHSAARHKMAVRPNKKKGPTRHRKPIDSKNLPSTPEVNEEYMKSALTELKDFNDKIKSRSLPPGVNAKILEQHSSSNSKDIKRSKTEKVSSQNEYNSIGNISKTISDSTKQTSVFSVTSTASSTDKKDDTDSGFFRRFLHRNSKRNQKKQQSQDELDNDPKDKYYKESKITQKTEQKTINEYSSHSQRVEETRQDIRREILSEAQAGMSLMLNSFILSTPEHSHSEEVYQQEEIVHQQTNLSSYKSNKPKSGPGARQRFMPKDLTNLAPPVVVVDFLNSEKKSSSEFITREKPRSHRLSDGSDSSNCGGLTTPKSILKISNEHLNSSPGKTEIVKQFSQLSNEDIRNSSTEEIAFKLHSTIKENTESVDKEHFEKREHRIHPPKIVALSPFQQKISRSEAFQLDYACPPVPKPRKSVEKSKSFRYYSEGQDIEIDTKLKKYDNMPSLPDLSFVRKSSFENIIDDEAETSVSLGFEINDNNLITLHSNEEPFPLSQGIFTKNIILTTTSKIKPNKNITEIEESIDKLLIKSQPLFVPILKKSTSMGDAMENKLNPNISITPIKKSETFNQKSENPETDKEVIMNEFPIAKMSEMTQSMPCKQNNIGDISPNLKTSIDFNETYKSKIEFSKSNDIISKSVDSICPRVDMHNNNSPKSSAATKARRSSSISSEKPECHGVPEFMKIQLNRVVDPCRPKSNIVLSKNIKTQDNGSNQDVKVNDTIEITDNKPPLPPLPIELKRNSFISIIVKDGTIITPIKTITSNDDDSPPIVLRTTENMLQPNLFERRKSVTDEKLKYEKKIEELKSERKKSITEETTRKTEQITENRKSSTDDDQISCNNNNNNNNGVILRKKSFGLIQTTTTVSPIPQQLTSKNNDSTPELMKVFARRSLKIKDDELQPFDEIDNTPILLKKFTNLDSDKENQSSSEEKLDKLPKIELTIQSQQKPILLQQYKNDEKLRNSLVDLRKVNNNTSNLTNNSSNNNNNNSLTSTPTKTFNRYSSNNMVNYNRNNITSTIFSNKKMTTSQNNSPTITEQFSITTMAATRTSQTTTTTTTTAITNGNTITNEENNNLMNDKSTIRHTIGPSNPSNLENTIVDNEFKGILQRRAEWEKRAKEALK